MKTEDGLFGSLCYNMNMFNFKKVLFLLPALVVGGCATWSFTPNRESQFVDEDNRFMLVEYGKGEVRETEFVAPNGVRLPFKSSLQVRITTPDGTRFVAYQNMSTVGNIYFTEDRRWEYFEEGTACILAERAPDGNGYVMRFQGVMCRNGRTKPMAKKPKIRSGGSTPSGFGRDSSGPRDSDGPRTVDQK